MNVVLKSDVILVAHSLSDRWFHAIDCHKSSTSCILIVLFRILLSLEGRSSSDPTKTNSEPDELSTAWLNILLVILRNELQNSKVLSPHDTIIQDVPRPEEGERE
jgi:hypothetical protein